MKQLNLNVFLFLCVTLISITSVLCIPLAQNSASVPEETSTTPSPPPPSPLTVAPNVTSTENTENAVNGTKPKEPSTSENETVIDSTETPDLEASGSENQPQTIVGTPEAAENSDNEAAASNYDPAAYGGLLSPEVLQQYINQYSAAYPFGAAYPAPVYPPYVPPPPPAYPSPFVVQTGYEGYIVPSTDASTSTSTGSSSTSSTTASTTDSTTSTSSTTTTTAATTTNVNNALAVISTFLSNIFMSTIFRVAAGLLSSLFVILFSGPVMNFICRNTQLCQLGNQAIVFMRRRNNAENVGRMIAENMTPERVRRAAEFVRNAIRKYHELQEFMEFSDNKEE